MPAEWVSKAIGKVEIERMRETPLRRLALGQKLRAGPADRAAGDGLRNLRTCPTCTPLSSTRTMSHGFSFPYFDMPRRHQIPFERRHLPDEKLTFDPKNIKAKARDGTAAPATRPAGSAARSS